MSEFMWEEIHGFQSLSEYQRFVAYLESQIKDGQTIEVPVNPLYHKGEIHGGRWFQDISSHETWRLIAPDFPFRGLWEKVDDKN